MNKWKYDLGANGKKLRQMINDGVNDLESVAAIYKQIIACLKGVQGRLSKADLLDLECDIDTMVEDLTLSCPEEPDCDTYSLRDEQDNLNEQLNAFYDFCDDNGIWVGV